MCMIRFDIDLRNKNPPLVPSILFANVHVHPMSASQR